MDGAREQAQLLQAEEPEFDERILKLAGDILDECRKTLMMRFRFLGTALWHMPHEAEMGTPPLASDGSRLCFEPYGTIIEYKADADHLVRSYLHSILHCVFRHPFERGDLDAEVWSLACDIFVESIALEMCQGRFACIGDEQRRAVVDTLQKRYGSLAPKTLARGMMKSLEAMGMSDGYSTDAGFFQGSQYSMATTLLEEMQEWRGLFMFDSHRRWAYGKDTRSDSSADNKNDRDDSNQDNDSENDSEQMSEIGLDASDAGGDDSESESADSQQESNASGEGESTDASDANDNPTDGDTEGGSQTADAAEEQQAGPEDGNPIPEDDGGETEAAREEWEEIAKEVEMDLASHAGMWGDTAGKLAASLQVANRKHYDYKDFLRRFCVLDEDMCVNDDEFDYIYYTYGLKTYGNMPLVEPLEYMETKRIREFAIVIDTSGSCSGELVTRFVERTFDILKESETFSSRINIHIIQADARVQNDVKVSSMIELQRYLDDFQLYGFGGTDFRPAFAYIDELIDTGEFENLQGVIYFTDGEGIYPKAMPAYETAFVFLSEQISRAVIPPWAMKVVMDEDDIRDL